MMLKQFKNRYINKKFWYQALLLYSSVSLICIITLSIGLTSMLRSKIQKYVVSNNDFLLQQITSNIDYSIFLQINSILLQDLSYPLKNPSVNRFLTMQTYENTPQIMQNFTETKKIVDDLNIRYKFLHSVILYNFSSDTAVSSAHGLVLNAKSSGYINLEQIDELHEQSLESIWITPQENRDFFDNDVITLAFAVPANYSKAYSGCILFNINMDHLVNYSENYSYTEHTTFSIISGNKKVIASSNWDAQLPAWIFDFIKTAKEGFLSRDSLIVSWKTSAFSDCVYLTVTPTKFFYQDVFNTIRSTVFLTLFILLLSLLIVYFATKRVYTPLRRALDQVMKKLVRMDSHTFMDIDKIVHVLSLQANKMENIINDNIKLLQSQLIYDILNGNVANFETAISQNPFLDIPYPRSYYTLIFVEINVALLSNLSYIQQEALYYDAINNLKESWDSRHMCLATKNNKYIIAVLSTDSPEKILELEINDNLNIGICRPQKSLNHLNRDYNNLYCYMRYSFIYGFGNKFTYDCIERFENSTDTLPKNFFDNLDKNMRSMQIETVKNLLENGLEEIKKQGFSYQNTQNILLQITMHICQNIRAQKISSDKFSKEMLLTDLNNINFLTEFKDWIFDLLELYQNAIQNKRSISTMALIDNISDYIKENLDKDLSLSSVADTFQISSAHLSRVFKQSLNINFNAFLTNLKLEKAAELLLKEPKLSINKIAENLGYYSTPYFTQRFKERYGFTPSQYRKSHLFSKD